MPARPLVRFPAILLLALLGVAATGAPSHHHSDGRDGPTLAAADRHGHGVQIVDLAERVTSPKVGHALPEATVVVAWVEAALAVPAAVPALSSPGERAPPLPSLPRAPPLPA